jgi:sec-independent protein translocase protein TatC
MADPEHEHVDRTRLQDPRAMSFGEHLEELRSRLIWALLGIIPIFVLSLVFGNQLLAFILKPARASLREAKLPTDLLATAPLEVLGAWLKVSGVVTVALGVPWIIFQLWRFIAPGLYAHERRFAKFLLPFSVFLSFVGLAFLYYVMLPAMLIFLIQFGASVGQQTPNSVPVPPEAFKLILPLIDGNPIDAPPGALWIDRQSMELRVNVAPPATAEQPAPKPEIRGTPLAVTGGIAQQYKISEYISLVFMMSIAFIAGFQTPVVVLLLGWVGIFDVKMLSKSRKYALFIAFVVGAILTPSPDPFSMTILAIPLYLLYELGLFLLKVLPPERVARGVKFSDFAHGAGAMIRGKKKEDAEDPPKKEPPDAGDE